MKAQEDVVDTITKSNRTCNKTFNSIRSDVYYNFLMIINTTILLLILQYLSIHVYVYNTVY